jgi:putative CocE/NonD family hydrolase
MAENAGVVLEQTGQFGSYEPPQADYAGTDTQSIYIPMRDGVRLAAEVILPAGLPADAKIPALLSQTRYWRAMELRSPFKYFLKPEALDPYFADFQPYFASRGYAIVAVDVRGTGASYGTWPLPWHEDAIEDAREIVDWIVAQPWSNGRVGGHGISYLGTTAELLATLNHPAVKCTIPMYNHPDAYSDIARPGGVTNERFIREWSRFDETLDQNTVPREMGILAQIVAKGVKPVDADGQRHLLDEAIQAHAQNGDAFALVQAGVFRDLQMAATGFSFDNICVHRFKDEIVEARTPIFGWASWMDAGTADAVLRRFLTFDNAQIAVIGAWEHGGRFNASPYQPPDLAADPPLPDQWKEMMRFFDHYLKGIDNGVGSERVLHYYTMGEEKWKTTSVWPPEGTAIERWYLEDLDTLSRRKPPYESESDSYSVEFRASTGDLNRWWELGGALEEKTVVYPNRREADRLLLTYTSPAMSHDTEITGYPVVTLYVTSTETDGAFYVYLEDVHPDGTVTYITEGQLRAIHRKVSDEAPPYNLRVPYHTFKEKDAMPLVPGEVAELTFGLLPTSVLIKQGHRIRVAIAGHDAGTFERVPEEGTPTITVARNSTHPSHIDLPIVPRP